MPFSSAPAFVVITYTSPKATHTMRIGTRAWTPPAGGFLHGSFPDWDSDTPIDAEDMINDLVDLLAVNMPDTHSFLNAVIYTQDDPDEQPAPRDTVDLATPGTIAVPDWWEAVQATWNFRDTDFTSMKLVLLDCDSQNLFGKLVDVGSVARWDDVADEVKSVNKAWSSRNGFRPATILSLTRTLNEKLRRAYGHTG